MVGVQVHVLHLQPVEPMDDVRPAGVNAYVALLVFDSVVYIFLLLQEVGEVWLLFQQFYPHLDVDPFQFLVRFETVAVEVLEFTVVFGQSHPVSVIDVVFVEYDTVVGVLWEQLVQVDLM